MNFLLVRNPIKPLRYDLNTGLSREDGTKIATIHAENITQGEFLSYTALFMEASKRPEALVEPTNIAASPKANELHFFGSSDDFAKNEPLFTRVSSDTSIKKASGNAPEFITPAWVNSGLVISSDGGKMAGFAVDDYVKYIRYDAYRKEIQAKNSRIAELEGKLADASHPRSNY